MRILELNMKHFGKFLEHRIKLLPGVNVIYGGNETGKTTMHAFIRAMFFGIETGRGRRGEEYLLRQPWDNPTYFAGSMRLEYEGKIYRIERNFYKNEREAVLVCETTGQELPAEEKMLTQFLAGMSETAFCNTVFIPQAGSQTSQEFARELQNFMINFQASRQDLNVETALNRLKARKKELETKKRQEQELLDEKIARKEMEQELLERELEESRKREERVVKMPWEGQEDFRKAEDVSGRSAGIGEGNGISGRDSDRREGIELWPGIGSEGPVQTDVSEHGDKGGGFYSKFLLLLNLLLLAGGALGVACGVLASDWPSRLLFLGLGVLLLALFVMTARYTWRERNALFAFRDRGAGGERRRREDGRGAERMRENARGAEDSGKEPERERRQLLQEQKRLEQERRLGRQQERTLRQEEQSLRARYLREEQEALFQEREALSAYDRQIEAVELAMMRIREVSQQIYRETGTGFGDQASEILEQLTEGRYSHIALDEKMQVKINTPSKLLDLNQVSFGTMNQIYFALRMAAGNLLSGGAQLPVILDEAFAMYDEERLEAALRWLNESGRQVILFTCQRREKEILDRIQ